MRPAPRPGPPCPRQRSAGPRRHRHLARCPRGSPQCCLLQSGLALGATPATDHQHAKHFQDRPAPGFRHRDNKPDRVSHQSWGSGAWYHSPAAHRPAEELCVPGALGEAAKRREGRWGSRPTSSWWKWGAQHHRRDHEGSAGAPGENSLELEAHWTPNLASAPSSIHLPQVTLLGAPEQVSAQTRANPLGFHGQCGQAGPPPAPGGPCPTGIPRTPTVSIREYMGDSGANERGYLRFGEFCWAQRALAERFLASATVLSPRWLKLMGGSCWFPRWGARRA